jgi:hypothetical protein
MSNQICVPQYSDDPHEQAAFAESYAEAFPIGLAEGKQIGATEERQRCAAILLSPEARGRESVARHFAFNTGMTAEEAIGALATVPKDTAGERQKGIVITGPWVA